MVKDVTLHGGDGGGEAGTTGENISSFSVFHCFFNEFLAKTIKNQLQEVP